MRSCFFGYKYFHNHSENGEYFSKLYFENVSLPVFVLDQGKLPVRHVPEEPNIVSVEIVYSVLAVGVKNILSLVYAFSSFFHVRLIPNQDRTGLE